MSKGFNLHKKKEEKEKCLFCQKPLDSNFLDLLSKHFSKDYKELQKSITEIKKEILKLKMEKIDSKNDDFYPDFKTDYIENAKYLNNTIEKINSWIDEAISKLELKHDNPLTDVLEPEEPEDFLSSYNMTIDNLNILVASHNEKRENHDTEVKNANTKLNYIQLP